MSPPKKKKPPATKAGGSHSVPLSQRTKSPTNTTMVAVAVARWSMVSLYHGHAWPVQRLEADVNGEMEAEHGIEHTGEWPTPVGTLLSSKFRSMALVRSVNGKSPVFGANCYLAENCTVVGDVTMGDECSVWFSAVVRGDVHWIRLGNRVNVQDGAVIHCTYQKAPTTIGNNVSIGHNALVHGCTLHDNVLVGMGAIVMDHAVVESNVIIAAGAVVLENSRLQSGGIYAGVPAKRVKEIGAEHTRDLLDRIAQNYVMYSGWFKADE